MNEKLAKDNLPRISHYIFINITDVKCKLKTDMDRQTEKQNGENCLMRYVYGIYGQVYSLGGNIT